MTAVAFHTGVADKLDYACRLLRKAYRQGASVAVVAEAAQLKRLDQALWTFEPLEFIPHACWPANQTAQTRLARTPIWLVVSGTSPPPADVLLNLACAPVTGVEAYSRVVEVVSADDGERSAGRERWRSYAALGLNITHHARRDPS